MLEVKLELNGPQGPPFSPKNYSRRCYGPDTTKEQSDRKDGLTYSGFSHAVGGRPVVVYERSRYV